MQTTSGARTGASSPLLRLAVAVLVSLVVAAVLVLRSGPDSYLLVGLPDPGVVTKLGTYLLRFTVDLAGAVCVGGLIYAAFFTASEPAARLSPDGWAAMRLAGWGAWIWFGSAILLIPFDAADSTGSGVGSVLSPEGLVASFSALPGPPAWLMSAVLALSVALSCHLALTWRSALALAAIAVAGVLPPVAVGNASSGTAHDYTMSMLAYHVVVAAAWLGVLVALVAQLKRGTGQVQLALRRYPRFATGCWLVLASTGSAAGMLVTSPAELVTTSYGAMVLAKVAGLFAMGVFAHVLRRRLARATGRRRVALGIAVAEIAVILVTVAVTMGMTQLPPPAWFGPPLSPVEVAIGYALPGPPELANLVTTWRFDLLIGLPALVSAVVYLLGVRRSRMLGLRWPAGRTAAWLGGCALVVIATSSGLGAYMAASFSVHASSHMVLNMLAPLFLVLGGPITLAMRVLVPAPADGPAGPCEWLAAVTSSPAARALSRPEVAVLLFVSSYYLLYFTPLFEAVISEHWSRMVLNLVVLAVGYLFFWVVVGVDRAQQRMPALGRLGIVFAVMPFHAVFSVIMLSLDDALAGLYFRTLDLPWSTDLLADQRWGAVLSLIIGELALVTAQGVLLWQWYREENVDSRGRGAPGDDEEIAYREMLDKLKRDRRAETI